MHRGQQVEALDCRPEEGGIIAVDDRLDRGDAPMPRQGRKARPDYRLAQNAPVLLGHVASGPEPATGSDDNSGDLHCHVRQSQKHTMWRHGFIPSRAGGKPRFCFALPDLFPARDFFAVQHLRIGRDWLNSMQSEIVAYFVCRDDK
jgi:hypothetical protein